MAHYSQINFNSIYYLNVMLKQPIKTVAKELSKLIPGLGQIVAPSVSVAMLEAAGWCLAEDMAAQRYTPLEARAA